MDQAHIYENEDSLPNNVIDLTVARRARFAKRVMLARRQEHTFSPPELYKKPHLTIVPQSPDRSIKALNVLSMMSAHSLYRLGNTRPLFEQATNLVLKKEPMEKQPDNNSFNIDAIEPPTSPRQRAGSLIADIFARAARNAAGVGQPLPDQVADIENRQTHERPND